MADKEPTSRSPESEAEVRSAISAFEQILEAMPNDRASLDAVARAYEELGDEAHALIYWIRLGEVLIDEADAHALQPVLDKLKPHAKGNPAVEALLPRMLTFVYDRRQGLNGAKDGMPGRPRGVGAIDSELSFAWDLKEAGELTEDEYASIAEDLTEMSATDTAATVSVLHVLEARGFKNIERIIQSVSKECRMPIVNLSFFAVQPALYSLLPATYCVQRGVFVFDSLGGELMVVVMNPYNRALQKEIRDRLGKPCHFFMTLPSDFDAALTRASEALIEANGDKTSPT